MKPRILSQGQNNWLGTRPPQNCADRYRIFGPLEPMDYPRPSIWQRIKEWRRK